MTLRRPCPDMLHRATCPGGLVGVGVAIQMRPGPMRSTCPKRSPARAGNKSASWNLRARTCGEGDHEWFLVVDDEGRRPGHRAGRCCPHGGVGNLNEGVTRIDRLRRAASLLDLQ